MLPPMPFMVPETTVALVLLSKIMHSYNNDRWDEPEALGKVSEHKQCR